MSNKFKPNWNYVSFEIAPVIFENIKEGTEVEVGGHECKIGDFLGRIEGKDGLPEIFVIPKSIMAIEWLKEVCRDREILNLDIAS